MIKKHKQLLKLFGISLLIATAFVISVNTGWGWFLSTLEPEVGNGAMLGSSITTIDGSDKISDSRTVINTNFTNLNNGKLEISDYISTTTDGLDEGLVNLYYTDARVGEYIDASTTMPVGDWNTAFGWGDHSLAGYYAAADYNTDWDALYNATSTFSGDLSISGNSTTTGYMYVGEDLTVNNQTSTSTINIYSEAADFGGSIIKEKEDGSGCTEQWSSSDGLEYFSDVSCP